MNTADCRRILETAFRNSMHSYRKGRVILHSIFAYGKRMQWNEHNPVDNLETPRVQEKEIVPLTIEEIVQLERAVEQPEHLRLAAGFTHWVPDVCRHTFASYHAAHFRNLPELQLEMGHSTPTLLRNRYLNLPQTTHAARFWGEDKEKPRQNRGPF